MYVHEMNTLGNLSHHHPDLLQTVQCNKNIQNMSQKIK